MSASKERVINEDSKQITGGQSTVRIVENVETGEIFVHRYFGDTKNIPTALRLKRSADEMLDDEEGGGQGEEQDLNDEEAQASADIAGRKKKRAPTRSAAKKQKKAAPPPDSDAPRATHQNEAGAYAPGTRRSARVSNANVSTSSSASSSQTPGPTVARREPVIREDAEENHTTTVQDGPSDGLHHIDDYNLRRSTRAASDDLNALSDRMNMFDIKSEAGSGKSFKHFD